MRTKLLIGGLVLLLVILGIEGAIYFRLTDRFKFARAQFTYPVEASEFETGFEFKNAQDKNMVGFTLAQTGPVYAGMSGTARVGRLKVDEQTFFDVIRISEGGTELVYFFASEGTSASEGERVEKGQPVGTVKQLVGLPFFVGKDLKLPRVPGLAILLRRGGQPSDLSLSDFAPFGGTRPEVSRKITEPREVTTIEIGELLGTEVPSFEATPVEKSEFSAQPVFIGGGGSMLGLSPDPGTAVFAVASGRIDITPLTDAIPPAFNVFILTWDGTIIRYVVTGQILVEKQADVNPRDRIALVGEAEVPITTDEGLRFRLLVSAQDSQGYPISLTPEMFLSR